MTAVLRISDGTTTISLLNSDNGFSLNAWRPAIAQYKGGGTWQASPLSDGRRMVTRQFGNAVEAFDLKVSSTASQDDIIYNTQELRRLLEKAVNYFTTDWQGDPVWVEAQATCETNPRYATIHSWSTPDDDNPFSSPFLQPRGAIMDDWTLVVERGHWQSTPPATSECQEISGLGVGNEAQIFEPAAGTDDALVNVTGSTINTSATAVSFGKDFLDNSYHAGVRFRNVTIDNAATILRATLQFQARYNDAAVVVRAIIVGEDNAAPAAFSTFANFMGRALTAATRSWNGIPAWTAGAKYRASVDVAPIIQEIVNLGGWASGNDLVIFIRDNGSDTSASRQPAAFEHASYDPAQLEVVTQTAQIGRVATCEKEVFVANKHNLAQLTHIYIDDGGVWSANLVSQTAYNLTPAVPILDDATYFGIDTTTENSGPFFSLVFDLAAVDASGDFVWEYWNGGAWHAFIAIELCDNTSADQFNNPFAESGVRSVHWDPQTNWATRNIATDGGPAVTGYWVRVRCTVAADVVTQQNRSVYSILWPYVTIESDVDGDIPAITEVQFEPKSFETGTDISPGGPLFSSKVLMGLRSLDRGIDFTPFINLQNEQNPDGITITLGASTTEVTNPTSTTGLDTVWNPAGVVAQAESVQVTFTRDLALQYHGLFRLMLRGEQNGGSPNELFVQIEHKINTYTTLKWSKVLSFINTVPNQILDFGIWQLPGFSDANPDEGATGLQLAINVESTDGSPGDLVFHDLILWPIDEWAGQFADTSAAAQGWIGGDRSATGVWRYLSADSIGSPRRIVRSLVKVGDSDIRHNWNAVVNGPAILQANKDQRLWFLSWANNNAGSLVEQNLISDPYVGSVVIVKKAQRYLSMRGSR